MLNEENGAPSQDTSQAPVAPPQLPTGGPPTQQAAVPDKPSPPAHEPSELDPVLEAMEKAMGLLKAKQQEPAYANALKQFQMLHIQLNALKTTFENEKLKKQTPPTEEMDKKSQENARQQNQETPKGQFPSGNGGQTSGLANSQLQPPQQSQ